MGSTQSLANIDSESDFVEMKENPEELEKMLTEIAQSKLLFDYDISALKKYPCSLPTLQG